MGESDLIRLSAVEATSLLRKGQVSPLELIDAAQARIEAADGAVNALPTRFFEQARDAARRLDPRRDARSHRPGWLAGLPIAVKDYNDVAGQPTTYGSPIFARNVAAASDLTVRTLEESGAIPIAKSNVPEFAGSNTFNRVFGATRNPWNLALSAGGSSGGSAAALASGMVWLATGNDLGGSLRIPASYCGVVGLRPSVGRVPRPAGNPAFDPLWVEGPLGRTVADVALMLDAQARPSHHDPLSLPAPAVAFVEASRAPKPPRRVGFTPDLGLSKVDPEIAAICRKATERLAELGAEVVDASPDFAGGLEAFHTLRAVLFGTVRGELLASHRAEIAPEIVWNIEKGLNVTADEVLRAERTRAAIFRSVAAFFDGHDLLACPAVAVAPFPVEQRFPTEIGGEKLETYIDWMFLTFVPTLTGAPAISIPCGFTADGRPVGLQLMARPRGDFELLAMAAAAEELYGLAGRLPVDPRRV